MFYDDYFQYFYGNCKSGISFVISVREEKNIEETDVSFGASLLEIYCVFAPASITKSWQNMGLDNKILHGVSLAVKLGTKCLSVVSFIYLL